MNIKQQRLESLLQEILSEALSQLNDAQINTLSITGVKCSKGKQRYILKAQISLHRSVRLF